MNVYINKDDCIGCGACVSICENVFYIEDNTAKVKSHNVNIQDENDVIRAYNSCPVNAIVISE